MNDDYLIFYSEELDKELKLVVTFVDQDPESNYYAFDFDAWDGDVDRKEELSDQEWDQAESIILHHLKGLL